MRQGIKIMCFLGIVCLLCLWRPVAAQAEIASDNAFEGILWEKIIEDDIEGESGIVQSVCATEDYIICMENYRDGTEEPDIIKAYYRNDTDAEGNPVERYSQAMRVVERSYEHANGMAYNPKTGEIAVALYTHIDPENRGCIFLMDSRTLAYKGKVKISDDYNILGIGYDLENDRYIIQTNADGGYSFKILDNRFQVVEDLGEYADTAKGDNFQDLCVSGDYIINFPLTLNLGIGDYIHMYSISRRAMVSDSLLNFSFENVVSDEPESICELEPGVFIAAVNVEYADGRRTICIYKTMVPYNFAAIPGDVQSDAGKEGTADEGDTGTQDTKGEEPESAEPDQTDAGDSGETGTENAGAVRKGQAFLKTFSGSKAVVILIIFSAGLGMSLLMYVKVVSVRRKRRRKLERARRERQRIRALYEE